MLELQILYLMVDLAPIQICLPHIGDAMVLLFIQMCTLDKE